MPLCLRVGWRCGTWWGGPFNTLLLSPPLPCPPPKGEFEEESKQPTMTEQQRHQLKHRELFLSRQFESLPATHIRWEGLRGGVFRAPPHLISPLGGGKL